jgi:Tfp pilus assembly protein PilX
MTGRARGMALPLTLIALVVVAALVSVGFGAALLEQRIGRNTLYSVQALGAAEAGLVAVLADWEGHGLGALAPTESAVLPTAAVAGSTSYTPTVTRLNAELFLVRVTAVRSTADGSVLAQRGAGLLVRAADSAVAGTPPVRPLSNRAWLSVSPLSP